MRAVVGWRWIGLILALGSAPALAQTANFGSMTLSPGFPAASGTIAGHTGGSFSLSSIANRDGSGNLCLGFGDSNPDHVIVLQQGFSRLNIRVDSGGQDTTLLIQGPNNRTVRCGDDTGPTNKDASIQGTDLPAGEYRVWVGSFDAGTQYNYNLTVQQ
jgi:hypothetical protein